jgi:hypothetical protein
MGLSTLGLSTLGLSMLVTLVASMRSKPVI